MSKEWFTIWLISPSQIFECWNQEEEEVMASDSQASQAEDKSTGEKQLDGCHWQFALYYHGPLHGPD